MIETFASAPKLKVLRHLWRGGGAHTGRELARAVGLDPKNASIILRELTADGLVVRRRAGRAYLYSLNSGNYVVSEILSRIFESERNWLQAFAAEIREVAGRHVEAIVLYGSLARKQAGPGSDVDFLIVVRSQANPAVILERINSHRLTLEEKYGRSLSVFVMTRSALRQKAQAGDRFVLDVLAQGQVVAGKPLSELVAHA
jgi:predicted nucleotidyltransferase